MQAAWSSPVYQQTVLIVLSFIFISGLFVYFFRSQNYYFVTSWASIKSWLIAAPILFGIMGAPAPWPLIAITIIAITGAKVFFQMIGMFQLTSFVLITYTGIISLALCIQFDHHYLYNVIPMLVLGFSCLVPLIRDSYQRMVQYISLTLLTFIFFGWSFMHLGLILKLPNGIYQAMYLIILTEFCDNTNLALSRYVGTFKLFPNINPKRTLGSTLVSIFLTLFLAGAMRHLLPDRSEIYWFTSGLIAALIGGFGTLATTALRKDLGIKAVGSFILGRSDFISRIERLVYTAPLYYYVMTYLMEIK